MNSIVAAVDFSPVSRDVIAQAVALGQIFHEPVVLLHVVQPPPVATELAPLAGEVLQLTTEIERGARRHLERTQERLAKEGVTVETVCEQGYPVSLIAARAKELDARYIVVGSHGHTAFYDLVVGSIASGLLKRSVCPVVVVPARPAKTKTRAKTKRRARRKQAA